MGYKMKGAPVHYGTKTHKSALKMANDEKSKPTITPEGQANLDKYKANFKKHTEHYEKNKDKYKMDEKGQYRNIKTNASVKEDVNKKESPAKQSTTKERLDEFGKRAVEYTFNPPKAIDDFHDFVSGGFGTSKGGSKIGKKAGKMIKDAATRKKMKDVEAKRREKELKKIKEKKRKVPKDVPKQKQEIIDYKDDMKKKREKDLNSNTPKNKTKKKKKEKGMTKKDMDKMPKGA